MKYDGRKSTTIFVSKKSSAIGAGTTKLRLWTQNSDGNRGIFRTTKSNDQQSLYLQAFTFRLMLMVDQERK